MVIWLKPSCEAIEQGGRWAFQNFTNVHMFSLTAMILKCIKDKLYTDSNCSQTSNNYTSRRISRSKIISLCGWLKSSRVTRLTLIDPNWPWPRSSYLLSKLVFHCSCSFSSFDIIESHNNDSYIWVIKESFRANNCSHYSALQYHISTTPVPCFQFLTRYIVITDIPYI